MNRKLILLTAGLTASVALTACGGQRDESGAGTDVEESSCDAGSGRLNIATGNATGVYYPLGGGIAKLINDETELQATSAETGASVQNIQQLVAGDYDVAFSLADTAADAVNGESDFSEAQDIAALGRIHTNYTHVVVRTDSGISSVEDFAGKTISTGSPQSGTEVISHRLIEAAGMEVSDVKTQALDLEQTVAGMKDGSVDGLVWSGGLPTPAITDLFTSMGDKVEFVDTTPLLSTMQETNEVYEESTIPADTYELDADVPTIVVPNLLLVRSDMPENLSCALTTLIWGEADKMADVHPAVAEFKVETASDTDPVSLHPGSERALEELAP
jgi:TRAP transporter TAXI family solute receptor